MNNSVNFTPRPIDQDVQHAVLGMGYSPLQARILAGRIDASHLGNLKRIISPSLADLDNPSGLPDIDIAVSRITQAIYNHEHIAICGDHDCDGVTSQSVLLTAFNEYFHVPAERLHNFVGHRQRDGYGVSITVAERIISEAPRPCLVITADQGSADHLRIKLLKEKGIETIVTDHHAIPSEGIPPDAIAVVNPARRDTGTYPDAMIAGCFVAWLVCCAVRTRLIQDGYLPKDAPKLTGLLDYVALGVVADCTSMGRSANNRAVVNYGLYLMNRADARMAWKVAKNLDGKEKVFTAQSLGFFFGPMVNSSSRIDDSRDALEYLMTNDCDEASNRLAFLQEQNSKRRDIEQTMTQSALGIAEVMVEAGRNSCAIYLEDGVSTVHGITASRIVEATGRPVAMLAPKFGFPNLLSSSARSIPEVNLHKIIMEMMSRYPEMEVKGGGHKAACGLTLDVKHLAQFTDVFELLVNEQLEGIELQPKIYTDGDLPIDVDFQMVSEMASLAPYGREFPEPVFLLDAKIISAKVLKEKHLKVVLSAGNRQFDAIWFGAIKAPDDQGNSAPPPIDFQKMATFAVQVDVNEFRGKRSLQLMVRHAKQ